MEKIVANFESFTYLGESSLRVKDFSEYSRIFESDKITSFFIGDPFSKVYYDKIAPLAKSGSVIVLGTEGSVQDSKAGLYFPSSSELTIEKLGDLLSGYPAEHPEATYCFLFTSTIDSIENFKDSGKNVKKARIVREQLGRIFPNVANFFVPVLEGQKEKEKSNYYINVWEANGFSILAGEDETELVDKISSAVNGLYSKEKIDSSREEKDQDVSIEVNPGTTDEFYKYFDDAIKNSVALYAQSDEASAPVYTYNPTVERAQIGLKGLNRGYDLPKFGADGLFGPETKDAVQSFKRDYKVGGDSGAMDTPFFSALLANLKSINFTNKDLSSTVQTSKEMTQNYFDLSGIGGNDEYLIYMLHQQGPGGAPALVEAMYGVGKLHPAQYKKNLTANVVGSYKGMTSRIRRALDSGNDQEAATLFLNMWKETYENKKKKAMVEINSPKHSDVKNILQKYSKQEGVPYDYLVTKAYIESGLNPKSGNRTYKGLFALDPNSGYAKKSGLDQSNVHEAEPNTKSAIYLLKSQVGPFIDRLNRKGLLAAGKVDLGEMKNLA